jgi:primary-amine oxidase
LKASGRWQPNYRFTEITVAEAPKEQVWKFALGQGRPGLRAARRFHRAGWQPRHRRDGGPGRHSVVRWEPKAGVQGMVLVDDFATVQNARWSPAPTMYRRWPSAASPI